MKNKSIFESVQFLNEKSNSKDKEKLPVFQLIKLMGMIGFGLIKNKIDERKLKKEDIKTAIDNRNNSIKETYNKEILDKALVLCKKFISNISSKIKGSIKEANIERSDGNNYEMCISVSNIDTDEKCENIEKLFTEAVKEFETVLKEYNFEYIGYYGNKLNFQATNSKKLSGLSIYATIEAAPDDHYFICIYIE